jgi:sugar lactone lactonase YvrE
MNHTQTQCARKNRGDSSINRNRVFTFRWVALGLIAATLTACPADGPTLEISPTSSTIVAGAPAVKFSATTNSSETIRWSLVGPGSISNVTGSSTDYTAPAATAISGEVNASLSASVAGLNKTSSIKIDPVPGSLQVNIGGLSVGVAADVLVTGPNGFKQSLRAAQALINLSPGAYVLTANSVRQAGSIVDRVFDGAVSPGTATGTVSVTAGATASTSLTYTPRGSSGGLWLANRDNGTLARYDASQLSSSGNAAPGATINQGAMASPQAVAFDARGNLWVADFNGKTVSRFSPDKLALGGSVTADVVISDNAGSLVLPTGMIFDANGNLWVISVNPGRLVKFTAAQLAQSGNPTPGVSINLEVVQLIRGQQIAFDSSGNLWIASSGGVLNMFTAAQLAQDGGPAPTQTIRGLTDASGLAFDASGNAWVARKGGISMFTPTQLVAGPSANPPTPRVQVSGLGINTGTNLAFDNGGGLWFSGGSGNNNVFRLEANQITSSGSPTPQTVISGSALSTPVGLAFSPAPSNVPILK